MSIRSFSYVTPSQRRRGNGAIVLMLGFSTRLAWLEGRRKDARYWDLVTSREDARNLLQMVLAEGELDFGQVAA